MTAADGPWQTAALCAQSDPEMWFSETDYYRAAAICRTCPVLAECAEETARDEAGRVPAYIQGVRAGLLPGARRRAAATATAA